MNKLFMLKIRWLGWCADVKSWWIRRKHCNKGFHKLSPCSWESTNCKKETLKTSWLECHYCNTLIFRNEEDKKIYLRLKEQEKAYFKNLFKAMMRKATDLEDKIKKVKLDGKKENKRV